MHVLLSCAALSGPHYLEITLPRSVASTSVQTALKLYLKNIEAGTTYLTDYIEFEDCDIVHILDLAGLAQNNCAGPHFLS